MNCQDPGDQVDDSITVTGYREPGMRGANVTYNCPSGMTLTGPRRSTCTGNGEWEPDPREVECKGEKHNLSNSIHDLRAMSRQVLFLCSKLWSSSLPSHQWPYHSLYQHTGRNNSDIHMLDCSPRREHICLC